MVDDGGSNGALSTVWAKLGGALAIFGAVFAVVTFVVPVGSQLERFAVAALAVAGSALLYQGIAAAGRGALDWRFASLVVVTLGLLVGYGVVLLQDRDGEIDRLRVGPAPASAPIVLPPGALSPAPATGRTGTAPAATPTPDDLPAFDPSNDAVQANGTLSLRLGRDSFTLVYWDICCVKQLDFTLDGISGLDGTRLALVAPTAPKTFQTCRTETAWRTAINWSELRRGSFICASLDSDQRALVRIDVYPDLRVANPRPGSPASPGPR